MRYFSLIFTLFFIGCSLNQKPKPDEKIEEKQAIIKDKNVTQEKITIEKKPKENFDWVGYYHGILPCADCKGVDVWLRLYMDGTTQKYELFENYRQKKSVDTKGVMTWMENNTIIKLKDYKKMLFKGSDFVAFVDNPTQSPDNKNILEKIQTFSNKERELLVNPLSVIAGNVNKQKAVKLDGILNVKEKTQYKSLKAVYIINCDLKQYATSQITYYDNKFATGKVVDVVKNSEGEFFNFDSKKDVLYQALKKYCNKK